MRTDFSVLYKKFREAFALRAFGKKYMFCSEEQKRTADLAANVKTYIKTTIPDAFANHTIWDLDGYGANNEELLPPSVALKVKNQVLEYCWQDLTVEKLRAMEGENLDKYSIMGKRRRNGDNVVIFSSQTVNDRNEQAKPKGKTLVAALIMREAIKLKINPRFSVQDYNWVAFSVLLNDIKEENDKVVDYQTCDWLVIDDIPSNFSASAKMRAYFTNLLDSFLWRRISDKLPTILVFRFDIRSKSLDYDEDFGTAISKIIREGHRIAICE